MSTGTDFVAKVRSEGKITIPKETRKHLNLKQGDLINVSINKPEWYEILDWSQMDATMVNFNALPENAQTYIVSNYTTDASGTTWRTNNV